eukprot:841033-Heterocapsa_arctica.AAC.1
MTASSDLVVREMLNAPSIDCILQRRRLGYFTKLVRRPPAALMSLLAARDRHGQPAVSWVSLIESDMAALRVRVPAVYKALPDPENSTQE